MDVTPRQAELLAHLVSGLSNKVIAQQMGVTYGTIGQMLHTLYVKTGTPNRTMLALLWTIKREVPSDPDSQPDRGRGDPARDR